MTTSPTRSWLLWLCLPLVAAGCYGRSELSSKGAPPGAPVASPGPGGPLPVEPGREDPCLGVSAPEPGASPLRRLNREEYDNTVRDLLGTPLRPAQGFAAEAEVLGFSNNAELLQVTDVHAEQFMKAAEELALAADLELLVPCGPEEAGCGPSFVRTFGRRAFRRPLGPEEVAAYGALLESGRAQYGFEAGARLVIQSMLQSPHFLYRVELTPGAPGEVVRLGPFELASRLSYLIWGSMPDEVLLQAAEQGQLATAQQVRGQAVRMLADPKARARVASFHRQWLRLDEVDHTSKDPLVYPAFTPSLRAAMKTETATFLDHVFFDGSSRVSELFDAPYTFANAELAAFYGLSGVAGSGFQKVTQDSSQRAGLLTQASFLAAHAKPNQSSPVNRGVWVRERILCQTLPAPPNDVVTIPPDPDPALTTRERFAEHTADPTCAGCHTLIDPIGFGFENYDGTGAFRALENGKPVDASGALTRTGDAETEGPFVGAIELSRKLADSRAVTDCLSLNWFRFAYGRTETPADACGVRRLQDAFAQTGYDMKELLLALTQTDAFLFRRIEAPAPPTGALP